MANRYWVGGTATWDATAGTKWATTDGGAGGASVPGVADDTFFTALSGAGTVTLTSSSNPLSINCTGFTGAFNVTGPPTIYGSFTLSAAMGYTQSANLTFAPAGTATINTAGKTLGSVQFGPAAGTCSLASALTSTAAVVCLGGTFTTNNYNITAFDFNSSSTNVRTINLGSSTVTLSSGSNAINFSPNTNLTFNAGTSSIVITSVGATLRGGPAQSAGVTFYNVSFTNVLASTFNIEGKNTFNNLSIASPSSPNVIQVAFNADQTFNGTLSTTGTTATNRVWFRSAAYGTGQILTFNSAPSLTDADFRDLYIAGTAAPISGTRIGNRGNCRGITFSTPKTVYWNLAGAQSWTANGWCSTSGGTPAVNNFPLPQDTAVFNNAGAITTITPSSLIGYLPTVNFSARTTAVTLASGGTQIVYGSLILSSAVTIAAFQMSFSGETTKTITSAGKSFSSIIVDSYGGSVTLGDATSLTGVFTVTNGTFNTAGFALTCSEFNSNNTNVRTINFGASTVTTQGNTGIIFTTPTNLTFSAGTSQINISGDTTTFAGGNQTFYNVTFTSTSTGNDDTITGSNTFNNLTLPGLNSVGESEVVISGNQIVNGTLTAVTSAANRRLSILSNIAGTQRSITANAVSLTNVDFRDINLIGTGFSGTRIGDLGGNTNVPSDTPKTVYRIGAGDWSDAQWATSSGGTPDINNFPLVQDTAIIDNASSAGTLSYSNTYVLGTLDMSARTSAYTFSIGTPAFICGSFINGTGVSIAGSTKAITFRGRGNTQTFTSAGATIVHSINVDKVTGSVELGDAINLTAGISISSGTFNANNYNVTISSFFSSSGTTLIMGSGLWSLTGTGSVWGPNSATVFYKNTANIILTDTSTTARTFAGAGLSYNKLTIGGTTGVSTLTITGNNQFTELASTKTVAHTIALGTTTQTFGKWSVTGTVGNVVTVTGTGTAHVIAGARVSGVDYLAMGTIGFAATSPGEFYAGANSTGSNATIIKTAAPTPVTRYWVGGTGNWDATTTTNWSATSGGAGGASVPTSADAVVFDSLSNATAYTVTLTVSGLRCGSFTMAGPLVGNVTWAGSTLLTVHGNFSLAATGVTRTFIGNITLSGSTTGNTFTTNGTSLSSIFAVNGVGCGWVLGSALSSGSALALTNGSFDTNNYNLTLASLNSTNANSRTFSFGSSTISLSSAIFIDFTNSINLTLNAGTSTIIATTSNQGKTFNGGGLTFYNVDFSASANSAAGVVHACVGQNTFNDLSFSGQGTAAGASGVTFSANQTVNGTLLVRASSGPTNRFSLRSNTVGTQRSITANAVSLTYADFQDINLVGSGFTGTNIGDIGGNTNVPSDTPKTVYRIGAGNWTAVEWATSSGGTPNANNLPLAQDTAIIDNNSTAGTLNFNTSLPVGTIDASARTTAYTIDFNASVNYFCGSFINSSTTALTQAVNFGFVGRGNTQTINMAGQSWPGSLTVNKITGDVLLGAAFTTAFTFQLNSGEFNANNYNVTCSTFTSALDIARTLTMGSGTWALLGTGTVWSFTNTTLLTFNKGTANIILTDTTTTARTFAGANFAYNKLTIGGTTGISTTTITGNNSFTELDSTKTVAHTIALGTTTQTVGAWSVRGSSGNVVTLTGSNTLIYTGAGTVSGVNYLNVIGKAYGPNGEISGIWEAGSASLNSGSLGWMFIGGGIIILTGSVLENFTVADVKSAVTSFNVVTTENSTVTNTQTVTFVATSEVTENSNLNDILSANSVFPVAITEPITLADSASGTAVFTTAITEPFSSLEAQVAQAAFNSDIVEVLLSAESETAQGTFNSALTEDSTLLDLISAQNLFITTITEELVSDNVQVVQGVFQSDLQENSTLLDDQTVYINFSSAILEALLVAETESAQGIFAGSLTEDSSLVSLEDALRLLVADITEDVVPLSIESASFVLAVSVTEPFSLLDSQTAQVNFNSVQNENSVLDDIKTAQGTFSSVLTENSTVLSIEDALRLLTATATEPFVPLSIESATFLLSASITEPFSLLAFQTTQTNFNSARNENSILNDVKTAQANLNSDLTENSVLNDTSIAVARFTASITEPLTLQDIASVLKTLTAARVENSGLSSVQSANIAFLVTRVENVGVANTQAATRIAIGQLAENITLADIEATQTNFKAAVIEALEAADLESVQVNFNSALTENVDLASQEDAIKSIVSDIVESFDIADSQDRTAIFAVDLTEPSSLADLISVQASFNSQILENLLILDDPIGRGWFRVVDSQTVVWTSVNNAQTTTWQDIGNTQTPTWTSVNNAQTVTWTNIGSTQNPNWVVIDNSQE